MKNLRIVLVLVFFGSIVSCNRTHTFPYQDVKLDFETRVDDLVSRMTLEEPVGHALEDKHQHVKKCHSICQCDELNAVLVIDFAQNVELDLTELFDIDRFDNLWDIGFVRDVFHAPRPLVLAPDTLEHDHFNR